MWTYIVLFVEERGLKESCFKTFFSLNPKLSLFLRMTIVLIKSKADFKEFELMPFHVIILHCQP